MVRDLTWTIWLASPVPAPNLNDYVSSDMVLNSSYSLWDVSDQILRPWWTNLRLSLSQNLSPFRIVDFLISKLILLFSCWTMADRSVGINCPLRYFNTCIYGYPITFLNLKTYLLFCMEEQWKCAWFQKIKIAITRQSKLLKLTHPILTYNCRHSTRFKSWLVRPRGKWLVIWWHLLP